MTRHFFPFACAALTAAAFTTATHAAPFTVTYDFEDDDSPRTAADITGSGADGVDAVNAKFGTGLSTPTSGFSSITKSIFVNSTQTASFGSAAITANDFIEFTIDAEPGFQFSSVDSFAYQIFAEDRNTGPANDNFQITTFVRSNASGDNFETTLPGSNISDSGTNNPTDGPPNYANGASANSSLGGDSDFDNLTSVTFRIFQFDNVDDTGAFSRIDNIVITGDVVPEPASLALLGLGGLCLLGRRRRSAR